jgi:hypothetical protein
VTGDMRAEPKGNDPVSPRLQRGGRIMSFGKGLLLWLIGIPIPVIIILALFLHH